MRAFDRRVNVKQVDILRGFAIVLMVANHAALALANPILMLNPIVAAVVFIGSFAPVVFFFTTGFGIGIARAEVTVQDFKSTLVKALLLVVADQFFYWRNKTPCGLDFLSFIAISTVVVTVVAGFARPVRVSFILMSIVLVMRFVLGPWLRPRYSLPPVANWLIGIKEVVGVSYPLAPWIIYPLLGFVMARLYKTCGDALARFLWPWPGAVSLAAMALAFAMSFTAAPFFRWGTVSFAFFVLSIGVIYLSVLGVWILHAELPRVSHLLSMRGIASLAVVPIHYALIEVFFAYQIRPRGPFETALIIAVLIVMAILLATFFAGLIRIWMSNSSNFAAAVPMVVLVPISVVLIWLSPRQSPSIFAYFAVGQLSVAGLLAFRAPLPTRIDSGLAMQRED